MIARVWHGSTKPEHADAYESHLKPELLPGLSQQRGFRGSYLLRRAIGNEVEFITIILRFIERFKMQVGISPKRYCRIRRFQQALTRTGRGRPVDWSQVALDCGYYDQAHFIHECRSFSGLTPTGYQASQTAFQNDVKVLQSKEGAV
jgi:hypothetical protein